jgi:hypothetical protein
MVYTHTGTSKHNSLLSSWMINRKSRFDCKCKKSGIRNNKLLLEKARSKFKN